MEETKTPRRPSFSEIEKASLIEATNEHTYYYWMKNIAALSQIKKKGGDIVRMIFWGRMQRNLELH